MPETAVTPTVETLFELLKQHSFQRGDFVLSSGKRSSYYMDGRRTTLSAEGAQLIGQLLFERLAPLKLDGVGGLTMGADPIVTAISIASAQAGQPLNGFLIRKEAKGHGTRRQIEGHLEPGHRVVLVEDVVTTGGSFIKAIEAVQAFSPAVEIVKLIALVDRHEGAEATLAATGIEFEALLGIDAFLQAHA